jgi:hypothetical protein
MMKKIKLLIPLLLTGLLMAQAQVKFTASSEKVVQTGERFRLVFTVNANASGFEAPDISNFDVLSGPARSTSQSFEYINGKSTQSTTMSFTYLLRAKKAGRFTIPQAKITVNGETHSSNSVEIEVIEGEKPQNQTNTNTEERHTDAEDLFVRVLLNKTKAYKGEALTATVKLYSRVDLVNIEDLEFPKYPGFFIKTIYTPDRINLERETYNGKIYNTAILRRDLLFPQKSGNLNIGKTRIDLIVRKESGRVRNFFGQWVTRYENQRQSISSVPLKVSVQALPSGKPDDFSGIVAKNLKAQTEISKTELQTDESSNLTIRISGEGNLHLLDEINLLIPNEIESFPEKTDNIRFSTGGASGNMEFAYLLIPRRPGKYKIPAARLSYFDTEKKRYQTIETKEIVLDVTKSKDYDENRLSGTNNETAEKISDDIRYLKQKHIQLNEIGEHFAGSWLFYSLYILSLLLFAGIIILKRKQIKERANIKDYKNKRAASLSRKKLKKARKLLSANNLDKFYKEVSSALWSYTANKFRLESSDLTKDKVATELNRKEVSSEDINQLIDVLNEAEYAQYGGTGQAGKAKNLYERAADTIQKLEHYKI